MTTLLIKLAVRLAVLTLVFWLAARRNKNIVIQPKWALPLVAGVFAVLNVGLYWLLKPILNLATLGAIGFLMPLVINTLLLVATVRIVERKKWLVIDGLVATLWMAVVLTLTHGVLWFGLDYLPPKL